MKYLNATSVLPDTLVKELQNYVQGGYIYIPIEQEQQKRWGEASGYRQELEQRNQQIKREYRNGVSIECLTEKYCLSLYTVRKIIYQKYLKEAASRGLFFSTYWFGSILYIEKIFQ